MTSEIIYKDESYTILNQRDSSSGYSSTSDTTHSCNTKGS
jgi:hypothetical protein